MTTDLFPTETSTQVLFSGDVEFRVSLRPHPLPIDLRRSWRIVTIVLTLAASRSNRAGREKLLLLNYALRNPEMQDGFLSVLSGESSPFFLEVRVDPALGRALDYALGLGLIRRAGAASVELSETGINLAKELNSDKSLLSRDKRFLERARKLATEAKVREILRWR